MYLLKRLLRLTQLLLMGYVSIMLNAAFALQVGVFDDIAVLNAPLVLARTKASTHKLEQLEHEAEALYKQITAFSAEFRKNEMVMDDKTRNQQQKKFIGLQKQAQAKLVAHQKQQEILQREQEQHLLDAATQVAKQKKLNLVFAKVRGVVYADADFDLTKDMIGAVSKSVESNPSEVKQPWVEVAQDAVG